MNIGDRRSISIWLDPWVLKSNKFRLFSPITHPVSIDRVANLIDHSILDWNH